MPRRADGITRQIVIEALATGAKRQKELQFAAGLSSHGSLTNILKLMRQEGIVEHGFVLTDAGRAMLEGK